MDTGKIMNAEFDELLGAAFDVYERQKGEKLLREMEAVNDAPSPDLDRRIIELLGVYEQDLAAYEENPNDETFARMTGTIDYFERTGEAPPRPGAASRAEPAPGEPPLPGRVRVVEFSGKAAKPRAMPLYRRVALVAAAVFAVSLTAFMSSSALRTAFFEMVATFTDNGVVITYRQVAEVDIPYDLSGLPGNFDHIYVPTRLPKGFINHDMSLGDELWVSIDYSDNAGNRIRLMQRPVVENDALMMTGDEAQFAPINIGGYEGFEMARSNGRTFVWNNHEYSFDLFYEGEVSQKTLLEVAKSLEKVEK